MQEKRNERIIIPEGRFEGYCDSCFYAKRQDKDAEGRIRCKGKPGGYRFPEVKNECKYYTSRIIQWIKIIVITYVVIALLVCLVGMIT